MRFSSVFSVAVLSLSIFSSNAFSLDAGAQVIEAADRTPARDATKYSGTEKSALQALKEILREKGIDEGSRNPTGENFTTVVVQSAFVSVSPYADNFMELRESAVVEAQLMAKRRIIEAISSDFNAIMGVRGSDDPVIKQIEAEQSKYDRALDDQKRQVELAQKETARLLQGVDDAQADLIAGASFGDRMMELLEAGIKKLDENYDSNAVDEEKAQRLENLKKRLENAKRAEDVAASARDEIRAKEEELKTRTKRSVQSSMAISAEMPLFGATAISSADHYNDLNQVLEVAIAVVWSEKLEAESRRVFSGAGNLEPRPGKPSLNEWLDQQDLAVMIGPRRYIAADGSINFLGFSAVEIPSDPMLRTSAMSYAEMFAKQAAILSVVSEVESVRAAERRRNDNLVDGKISPKTYKSMAEEMKQSAQGKNFAGLDIVTVRETVHPASGKPIYVAVGNVNSAAAQQSDELLKDAYALLKEFNAIQSTRQGEKAGMIESANETRNNQALINAGRRAGAAAVDGQYQENTRPASTNSQSNSEVQQQGGSTVSGGSGQSGVFINRGRIERDF
jgi:hypothetical protein